MADILIFGDLIWPWPSEMILMDSSSHADVNKAITYVYILISSVFMTISPIDLL